MILQPGSRPVPNSPDYVLVRKLGTGAFGQVWHAHGPGSLDAALKFIPHVPAHELRSLDAMKSIRHPNLVSLFGAWHKDDWLILAMERHDCRRQDRLTQALVQTSYPGCRSRLGGLRLFLIARNFPSFALVSSHYGRVFYIASFVT